jgi:hypothetical protein
MWNYTLPRTESRGQRFPMMVYMSLFNGEYRSYHFYAQTKTFSKLIVPYVI